MCFHEIIAKHWAVYDKAKKCDKTVIAQQGS
jgi:hypothetical protein